MPRLCLKVLCTINYQFSGGSGSDDFFMWTRISDPIHYLVNYVSKQNVLRNLNYDYISFQSLGLTQSNLMDLCLLSRSVVRVELNFDSSKDSCEGSG